MFRAMHGTVGQALNGLVKDITELENATGETEHAREIRKLNWSWALREVPYPNWNDSKTTENLSDFDSMAINIGIEEAALQLDRDPFVHLEHFVIDMTNSVAWTKKSAKNFLFKLMKTAKNDRARSSLTNRKTFDLASAFQAAKSDFFAKETGEFAEKWYWEYNGLQLPTPKQVLMGLQDYYVWHMDKTANEVDKASQMEAKAAYQRVFSKIELLLNFPDMNRPFNDDKKDEYDLYNPDSKCCFLVLFLYSIEPPFYFALNHACRKRESQLLPMFGPFAYALYKVLGDAERRR